ncbi:MAG TPA: zinc ribbon domain-containing protein [Pyrinomonadaceae bacterium]|nr:zinc ribbon domain-containing protein [Pyrinomonadaceae bacterium]
MFCPKCATQNVDGASFCRSCGANISLIPGALSGTLPQKQEPADEWDYRSRRRKRRDRPIEASMEKGVLNIFIGLGFIVAALAVMFEFPAGMFWGWSFFIPGFSTLGRGVASIMAARNAAAKNNQLPAGGSGAYFQNPPAGSTSTQQSSPQTGRLMNPVPSVTEGTTRHLGAEAPTRHFDPVSGEEKLP